jgi:hypothetical protein
MTPSTEAAFREEAVNIDPATAQSALRTFKHVLLIVIPYG